MRRTLAPERRKAGMPAYTARRIADAIAPPGGAKAVGPAAQGLRYPVHGKLRQGNRHGRAAPDGGRALLTECQGRLAAQAVVPPTSLRVPWARCQGRAAFS